MNRLHLRPAVAADMPRIVAGINAVCAEGGYFHTPHYVPTPQWEVTLHQPESVPDHLLLVAESDDGEFVGAVQIFPILTADQPASLTGELGIYILKPFRGKGAGTVLMRELLDRATACHYTKAVLSVLATNSRAIHLYMKFGFVVEYQRRREYAFLGEQDELVMARSLP